MTAISKKKNQFLIVFRKTHAWLGIVVLAFVVIIGGTGLYLNHKKFFNRLLRSSNNKTALVTTADLPSRKHPITVEEAKRLANTIWKDRPIKKFVKRIKRGRLLYRISKGKRRLIIIDAATGSYTVRSRYLKKRYAYGGKRLSTTFYWKRILRNLHTGRIGGKTGKLLADITSISLIILAGTGIYLWLIPEIRKHRRRL